MAPPSGAAAAALELPRQCNALKPCAVSVSPRYFARDLPRGNEERAESWRARRFASSRRCWASSSKSIAISTAPSTPSRNSGRADQLQLKRLKKKKLYLKDEIARIEDQLLPDIIA